VNYLDFDWQMVHQHNEEKMREVRVLRMGRQLRKNGWAPSGGPRAHKMKKTLLLKEVSWRNLLELLCGVASSE
jgi:hypothetical protein